MNEELREAIEELKGLVGGLKGYGWKAPKACEKAVEVLTQVLNASEVFSTELLHNWYLEATDKLDPASFNREAQKPYSKLTKEQKFIDEYIADKIALTHTKLMLAKDEQISKIQADFNSLKNDMADEINIASTFEKQLVKAKEENEKLRGFVDFCFDQVFEGCDIDGGDAQEKAAELGLIELRPIKEEDSIDGEKEHYFTVWTPKAQEALDNK